MFCVKNINCALHLILIDNKLFREITTLFCTKTTYNIIINHLVDKLQLVKHPYIQ